MQLSRKTIACVLLVAVLSIFAVSTAAAAPTEVTYMCWYNTTQSEAQGNQAIIDKFRARGIDIPFPQREVRMLGQSS